MRGGDGSREEGRRGRLIRGGGWQDLDIAACIPEAIGLISSHDNVPRNVDSPPLSSIAWRERVSWSGRAHGVRQLRDSVLKGHDFSSLAFAAFSFDLQLAFRSLRSFCSVCIFLSKLHLFKNLEMKNFYFALFHFFCFYE